MDRDESFQKTLAHNSVAVWLDVKEQVEDEKLDYWMFNILTFQSEISQLEKLYICIIKLSPWHSL